VATPTQSVRSEITTSANRLVVKIGTGVLSDERGQLDTARIEHLAGQICDLRAEGYGMAVVTSGAIGAGLAALGIERRPKATAKLQAAAAIGQSELMAMYDRCFQAKGFHSAQMLLTRQDFEDFRRYLNMRRTVAALHKFNAIPVINENDTVSVDEITFGDNDTLSALVASLFEADLLILLSTVDGLYDSDGPTRRVIEVVDRVTTDVEALAFGATSRGGVGGMESKLRAVKTVTEFGETVIMANGKQDNVLRRIVNGENLGTLFLPAARRVAGRKRWLMFGGKTKGKLWIDDGAVEAISKRGKSLLPSGVTKAEGAFASGDVVAIMSPTGELVAKGVTGFGHEEAAKICGLQSKQVAVVVGRKNCDEIVHRDNMVVFHKGQPA